MTDYCDGQHADCPWCETVATAKRSPFEVLFIEPVVELDRDEC